MYYVKFDQDGIQEEIKWSDEPLSEGWYSVGKNIDGKFFKLTSSGNASAMTENQLASYRHGLLKSSILSNLRIDRDRLLMESDWTQLPNSGLSEELKGQWESYRQKLRDLPETIGEDLSYELPAPPQ